MLIKSRKDYTWDGVDILHYKQEAGTHFDKITRQVLFGGRDDLDAALRYFQLEPGGYSTLEKHRHVHCVLIIRGTGKCLAEGKVESVSAFDLVEIPPWLMAPVCSAGYTAAQSCTKHFPWASVRPGWNPPAGRPRIETLDLHSLEADGA